MLSTDEIGGHLAALRVAIDPKSPFYKMVGLECLVSLPIADQWQILQSMNDELREMFHAYRAMQKGDTNG